MAKLNENKYYQNYEPGVTQPWWLASEITKQECDNLQNGKGTLGVEEDANCDAFNLDLIPAIADEFQAIRNGDIVISANEDSKCSDGNPLPTIASILSRILRFSQAVACVLCTYDPVLINILKSGHYPQVLMGQTGSKYPIWRAPSETPTAGSKLPITSGGVWEAIQQAVMSVFHEATDDRAWVENGGKLTYDFFTKDVAGLDTICEGYWGSDETPSTDPCPKEGDTALVQNGANGLNQEYLYENGAWVPLDVMKAPSNYAVIHINKGAYRDEELYWLDVNGEQSWNQMDVSDASLRKRLEALEAIYAQAVLPVDGETQYLLTTAANLGAAKAVPCTEGKQTIVLITG